MILRIKQSCAWVSKCVREKRVHMERKEAWEENVKAVLLSECDGMTASRALKDRIDEKILESEREAGNMKHVSVKKLVIGVAVGCLLVSGGVFATGHAVSLTTHHYHQDDIRDYGELSKVEKKLGYTVDATEEFANGYRFDHMELDDVKGKDEGGNEVYTFPSLDIRYTKSGENSVSLFVEKPVETSVRSKTPDETRVCGDVTLYYDTLTNKQVPPDYVMTEEDKANEKRDDYFISVGSAEVEIHQNQTVTWDKDGVRYQLLGFDLNLSADDMFDMAEEIMGIK